ncbi:CrcB protein [Sanguibacter gelidistatuariae]|uniref:Fluoride-specific ion channel FluC n=1 Tax=Sanguibacter gelidistatuariae TaxID=1814289 RepID=A0A1G6J911_9MICO|nr:CrcB family protein [Sanguibacter gelidistatuariae]SDC14825.1 CrcB protein [Sanguibacter gelidistatuariae]
MAGRPNHLRWLPLALVALGGAVGAATREGTSLIIPDASGVPVAIAIVNVLGAFALGYLYEAVTRLGPGNPTAASIKLLLGTGFCGGFTTYSSLATDSAVLLSHGRWGVGSLYAFGTLLIGACATFAGIAVASRANARRNSPEGARR